MPQLNAYTWGTLPLIIVIFFGINWIFFILYTRLQSKTVLLFSSYLQYKKAFFLDLLKTSLANSLLTSFNIIAKQGNFYKNALQVKTV